MKADIDNLTAWLGLQPEGAPGVTDEIFQALYGELRRLARSHMRREGPAHTLSATALLHEAWFRLAEQRDRFESRSHFLALASTMMRRILVNHAVAKRADKRDAELVPLTSADAAALGIEAPADAVAVHEALLVFETIDPRAAKMVEMRFFGGLSNAEIAQALEVSVPTVKRDWDFARAWLRRELAAGAS